MRRAINRREFLISSTAASLVVARSDAADQAVPGAEPDAQTFHVGYAPELGLDPTLPKFWQACDACHRLGFHHVETNNGRLKLVQAYSGRIPEFKSEMAKRNLTLVGMALGSDLTDPSQRQQVIDYNLQVARFLQAVGGKYISLLFDYNKDPSLRREEALKRLTREDFRHIADTANDVGKRLRNETGIHLGYHPERYEVRAGMIDRVMEMTDPEAFYFVPDVGHITAGGGDPLQFYKKYRLRMVSTHFKDWDPTGSWNRNQPGEKGHFVALGEGIAKLPPLVAYLKESKYTGYVMVELDDQPDPTPEMRAFLTQKLGLSVG
jgi:inosose dehydratase